MARTLLEARTALVSRLNANVLDPYPGTRPGNQFLNESDGINLSRANTFPKGIIRIDDDEPFTREEQFYKSGYNKRMATFNIFYLVKEKISYTDTEDVTYKEEDYAQYMKEQIITTLQNDLDLGDGYFIANITNISSVEELTSDEFPFKLYQILIPVTIKWINKYGQA